MELSELCYFYYLTVHYLILLIGNIIVYGSAVWDTKNTVCWGFSWELLYFVLIGLVVMRFGFLLARGHVTFFPSLSLSLYSFFNFPLNFFFGFG